MYILTNFAPANVFPDAKLFCETFTVPHQRNCSTFHYRTIFQALFRHFDCMPEWQSCITCSDYTIHPSLPFAKALPQ